MNFSPETSSTLDSTTTLFPLSAAQRGLWFAQHLAGDVPISIAQFVEIHGSLDMPRLVDAAMTAGREFGTGYLRLVDVGGVPMQTVDSDVDDSVPTVDLRQEADPIAAAHAWMRDEYSAPMDLLTDRLVTMAVLRVGEEHIFWYSRIHHIALDGYGAMTLLKRCAELYTNGDDASAAKAEPLHAIVDADQQYRSSDRFAADRDYWTEHLAGLPDPVSLAGRSAPAAAHPRVQRGELDSATATRLEQVASDLQSSIAPVTVAAFGAYLARATGNVEVTLSLPVSARTTASLRRSGGMVANVVPLRLRCNGTTSVADMVRDAQLELTGALRRQRYRQEDIARDLGVDASGFGPSVNMMMFDTRIMLGPFVGRLHVLTSGMIDDLFVNVYPGIGGSSTHIDFQANSALYSADELAHHHAAFMTFLDRFLADPYAPVSRLKMTDDDAVHRGATLGPTRTMPQILADAAAQRPNGVAVASDTGDVSYRDLDEQSNRLARALIGRGARPETTVAVAVSRSYESILAMWAVAKTGAAFVPVDPTYPSERIDYLLADSRAHIVVDTTLVHTDLSQYSSAPVSDADRHAALHSSNAAYIIYTSGSTGTPKGVVVTHGGLADLVSDGIARLALSPASRMTHSYSPSFDASLSELLLTFGAAATAVVVPPGVFGGDDYAELLRAQRVTHIDVTPAVLGTLNPRDLPDLTHVVVGGDACPPELRARWAGEKTMLNGYGPTEMTVTSTLSAPMTTHAPVTIGAPIRGTSALVLDRWLQSVPAGATGELYLSGGGIARGYSDRPSVTSTRFVADPHTPGGRLYRTGDIVRWTDGELEYLGRTDFQVKIRGFRIELGEVDAAISHAALSEDIELDFVMTLGHTTESGATVLVAYVVAADAIVDTARLTAELTGMLPAYMVPSSIMVLDTVPLTPVGKVDRKALPAPVFVAVASSRKPSTPREVALAELFQQVLGVDEVGAEDSFFALGGDSIVSIQLVSRGKSAGLVFTARDVFERKTVAGLAEVTTDAEAAPVLTELPGGGVGTIPTTPIVADMLSTGHFRTYSQAVLITLPDDITDATLISAAARIIDHHDALRSRVRGAHEIISVGSINAETVFTVDAGDLDTALDRAADRLDPAQGRVVQLVRIENKLWIVLHHIAVDGVSWRILLPDFAAAAAGSALPENGTSLRRWAHGLAEHATERLTETPRWSAVAHTQDPLLGSRALDTELDVAATRAYVTVTVPAEVTETLLTTLPDRFQCGPNEGLLTALALAVAAWRHRHTAVVTLEGHGREQQVVPGADLARTVGWFTTVFPVAFDLGDIDLDDAFDGGPAAGTALKTVKETLATVPDHGIGYGMLRHSAGVDDIAVTPQLSFNYLGRVQTAADSPWMPERFSSRQDEAMPLPAAIDINAFTELHGPTQELVATFAYASGLFDRTDIGELTTLWLRALSALAAHARAESMTRHSPSDFALVPTTQHEIEAWEGEFPSLTDVWPLSPLQEGLLFHAVFDAEGPDSYVVQSVLTLAGVVDSARLHDAAQALVDRHENLRVAFLESDSGPRQIVLDQLEISWTETDLRGLESAAHAVDEILESDRSTRFDMADPPLIRFALIRTSDDGYRLLMTNHHILLDGWSTPLLVQELLTLYAAFDGVGGLRPARSYREYLGWLAEQDREASRLAWRTALTGIESATLLAPAGRLTADAAAGERSRSLGPEVTAALHGLARSHGITVNTAIQTVWALLLSSLTGATDVVFGGTVSGRPPALPGVEEMVGLFINTVPVRVQLDPRETLAQLMTRVQQEQSALLDHQYVGLSEIHDVAGLPELFDTITVFESYPVDREALAQSLDLAGMRVLDAEGTDATPYPLSLLIIPGDSIVITLKYLESAVDSERAQTLVENCVALLTRISAEPELPVTALDVGRSTATVHGGPGVPARTLGEILTATAERHPDRTAVSFRGVTMTYRELEDAASRLAHVLIGHGARPEAIVAIAIPRSIQSVVAMWAVARTGAAFVPIDPSLPADRIDRMLADCGARTGLTVDGVLPPLAAEVTWLDAAAAHPAVGHPVVTTPHLDHLAYLIFTSGSTGTPKAVEVTHRGLANFVVAQIEEFRVDETSRVLHFASPSFDASISEALMAFGNGATLVVAPPTVMAGDDLAAVVVGEQVSHMVITPAALATVEPAECVRVLAVAGEAPSRDVVDRWSPGRIMLNHYGPTEFTIWATGSTPLQPNSQVDIGVPIRGATILVLDSWLRPVADGVAGELYLAGPAVARGYRNRTDLTSTRFVAHPVEPGARMYRTGDIVRWDGDRVHYLGRADFQVKIRGFRVELGEVDAVLTEVHGVEFAVTVGVRGPSGTTVLVSYVLPSSEPLDTEMVRRHATERLPGYMVPTLVQVLDAIPLTPVGKIDTRALPDPDFSDRRRRYRAPRTPLETLVVDVFTDVLAIDSIGIDDSFFDLGGNSLVATRVVSRINSSAGSAVALRDLFEAPTPAGLATKILSDGETHPRRLSLVAGARPHDVPLSSAQQRMWFLNRFESASAAYNMPMAIRLTGTLDGSALESAVHDVLARHEVLRTVYPQSDTGPVQVVLPVGHHVPALTPIPVDASELETRIVELASRTFDVTAEVPLRVNLFDLGADEHVIVMVLHHISGDGWSMGPLARDLMVAYSARLGGQEPQWAPLSIQYSDYALWQRELLGDEADDSSLARRQLDYWTLALTDLPDMLELPTDRPRPPQQSYRGGRAPFSIDAALHARLDELARRHETSMFMLLHTAFAVVLARLAGTDDVTVGSPVAGRGEQALDDLIGMFVNTLVLRTHVDAAAGFDSLLTRTREDDLQAFAHADIPFERLVEVLAPQRSTARHPLFQVGFSFENLGPTTFELPGLQVSRVEIDAGISQFDLHLIVVESPDSGIDGWFTYAADLFDAATVETIGARLLRVLGTVLENPSIAVGDIDLLDESEREQVSRTWNDTAHPLPALTLPQMIDRHVETTPDAPAVVMADESLTYREFDARSNRLARYLIERGAGPDSLVALAMSRSIEQIVAMHAVVKAGAGYVPIDPTQPANRIEPILDSAQPICVLTTSDDAFADATSVDTLALTGYDAAPVTDADRVAPLRVDNTVYVLFTSGSTGRPKGVALTHSAVANQLRWLADEYDVTTADRFLVLTPATFDLSVWQYWTPLVTGSCAVLHPAGPLDPHEVRETIGRHDITMLSAVPAILDAVATDAASWSDSVRNILAIGDTLPASLASRLRAISAVHNLYGPTEAAVSVTAHAVDAVSAAVPIGVPEWNTTVHVLDERLRPTPPGVPGELYLAGIQLARGYLGRPGITSDRFVADPFGPAGSRLYRTGDLASWTRDGELMHLGRSDFQVKIRGFRIELGDIENALTRIAGVRSAVVVATSDHQDTRLVAYVAADESAPDDLTVLLAETLPSYMVPSALVRMDRLPMNANGKVDRTALPEPVFESAVFVPPTSPTELAVAQAFSAALGVPEETIGAHDDFFALGGTSLLATRVADSLRTHLNTPVSVAWMFSAPTVEALARRIDDSDSIAATSPFDPIVPLRVDADLSPLFCIHPASGLAWCYAGLAASLEAGRSVYGIQSPELTGAMDAPATIDEVVDLYVQKICSVQPHGPYNLLGWSFGGFVAHGVAARMRERGEEVSMLAMLDPNMESCELRPPDPIDAVAFFREFAPVLGIDDVHEDISVDDAAQLVRQTLGTDVVQADHIERLAGSYNNALSLLADYRPPVYDGDVMFFSAAESVTAAASWAPYVTGRIVDHAVDSVHDRMMEPSALQTISSALHRHHDTLSYADAS